MSVPVRLAVFASVLLCAALTLARGQSAVPPAATDARFERLASVVTAKMKEYGVPGVAIGILADGQTSTRGFGITNVDHPLPVTDETLFQVGSISKTFTGTALMRLLESGKLKLDAPVRTYIPEFRVADETAAREATVLTTVTHMGGWEGDLFEDTGPGDDALARMMEKMRTLEQVAPINTVWSYNNAGFYVAGRLIEIASGKPYEQTLKELVLQPLGLEHTFIFPTDVMTHRFVVGHGGPMGKPSVMRPWPLARAAHAAGGVVASVKDLLKYGQFHVGDGTAAGGTRVLSPESMQRMQSTQLVKHMMDEEMAITWHVSNAGGVRQVSHGGSTLGQQALLTLVPTRKLAVVLLTNSGRGGQLNRDVTRAALKEYLGITITDPAPITTAESELSAFVGRYSRPYADVVATLDGTTLMLQAVQKRGFPTPDVPPPPPQPPAPYQFYAKDRLIATDAPSKGARAEIIRKADGTIGWIRVGGRVARRVDGAATSSSAR